MYFNICPQNFEKCIHLILQLFKNIFLKLTVTSLPISRNEYSKFYNFCRLNIIRLIGELIRIIGSMTICHTYLRFLFSDTFKSVRYFIAMFLWPLFRDLLLCLMFSYALVYINLYKSLINITNLLSMQKHISLWFTFYHAQLNVKDALTYFLVNHRFHR